MSSTFLLEHKPQSLIGYYYVVKQQTKKTNKLKLKGYIVMNLGAKNKG